MIERFRLPSEYNRGVELPVVAYQPDKGNFVFVTKNTPRGCFDLWVCAACGYTEFWARELSGLKHNPGNGVHLIDTTPEPEGPFR